jgi:hypothetical protein
MSTLRRLKALSLKKMSFYAVLLGVFALPRVVFAENDAALERRIEKKVSTQHEAGMKKARPTAKATLSAKADSHSNSALASIHAQGRPKAPPRKPPPPPKKKPAPPHR